MEDWEKERIERAKKGKIEEVLRYFAENHNTDGLKYACYDGKFSESQEKFQTHFYLVREGFRWIQESDCFVGVTERIYDDAKDIVSEALRKYGDIVKQFGTVGSISLTEDKKSIKGIEGKLIKLVA